MNKMFKKVAPVVLSFVMMASASSAIMAAPSPTTAIVITKAPTKVGQTVKATNGSKVTLVAKNQVAVQQKTSKKATVTVPSTIKVGGKTLKVTTLNKDAFNGKTVKTVKLPSTITKINANAFAGDKKLKTLNVTSKKLTVSKSAFKGLSKKQKKSIKVTVSKKMSKANFNKLKKQLLKAGLKASNIKRK